MAFENFAASTLRCLAPKPLFVLKTVFLEEKKTFSNKSEKDITSISRLAGESQNNQFLIEFAYGRLCSISRMFLQLWREWYWAKVQVIQLSTVCKRSYPDAGLAIIGDFVLIKFPFHGINMKWLLINILHSVIKSRCLSIAFKNKIFTYYLLYFAISETRKK